MAGVTESGGAGSGETANRDGEQPVVERAETAAEATVHEDGTELERTIGLTGGAAIGVGTMIGRRPIEVTLFHVAETETDLPAARSVVSDARESLLARGVASERIVESVQVSDAPVAAIAEAATEHDAVVMGESAPSLRSFFLGEPSEQIAAQSLGPVVVVRREREAE